MELCSICFVLKLSKNSFKKKNKQINYHPYLFKMTCTEFLGLVHVNAYLLSCQAYITASFLFVSAFNA